MYSVLVRTLNTGSSDLPTWIALVAGVLALMGTLGTAFLTLKGKKIEAAPQWSVAADKQEAEIRGELREENRYLKERDRLRDEEVGGLKEKMEAMQEAYKVINQANKELKQKWDTLQKEHDHVVTEMARKDRKIADLERSIVRLAGEVDKLKEEGGNGHGQGGK